MVSKPGTGPSLTIIEPIGSAKAGTDGPAFDVQEIMSKSSLAERRESTTAVMLIQAAGAPVTK